MKVPNQTATRLSAFDIRAPRETRDLIEHLASFVGTTRVDASPRSKESLLDELSSKTQVSARLLRRELERTVPGLSEVGRLPVESLVFIHELRANGFEVKILGQERELLSMTAARSGTTNGISVDLSPGSQGFAVSGAKHAATFERILLEMTRNGLMNKPQGNLHGDGRRWQSYEGTGIEA